MENVFNITEKAAEQVVTIQKKEGKESSFLRISVVGGGCSGLSYRLNFEENKKDSDLLFDAGVKIIIDRRSIVFLRGAVIDFTDGLTGQGFTFNNPNSKSSCGCGQSFST